MGLHYDFYEKNKKFEPHYFLHFLQSQRRTDPGSTKQSVLTHLYQKFLPSKVLAASIKGMTNNFRQNYSKKRGVKEIFYHMNTLQKVSIIYIFVFL